jgi:hypothetical protein
MGFTRSDRSSSEKSASGPSYGDGCSAERLSGQLGGWRGEKQSGALEAASRLGVDQLRYVLVASRPEMQVLRTRAGRHSHGQAAHTDALEKQRPITDMSRARLHELTGWADLDRVIKGGPKATPSRRKRR